MIPDHEIESLITSGRILVKPFFPENVQPASIDLTLSDKFRVISDAAKGKVFDLTNDPDPTVPVPDTSIKEIGGMILYPDDFCLGCTEEYIALPNDIQGEVSGRSSIGRSGVMVHITAGFIDPGYKGRITLEFKNVGPLTILIRPGIRIGQISFQRMDSKVRLKYGHHLRKSKYQNSLTVEGARPDAKR